jgi:hypothetical protein
MNHSIYSADRTTHLKVVIVAGEHHQGHVTVPAMPGSALVVIEPELVFRGLYSARSINA